MVLACVCLCSRYVSPAAWSGSVLLRNCSAKLMNHREHQTETRFSGRSGVPFVLVVQFSAGSVVGHSSACHLLNVTAAALSDSNTNKQKLLLYILHIFQLKGSLFMRLIRWPTTQAPSVSRFIKQYHKPEGALTGGGLFV